MKDVQSVRHSPWPSFKFLAGLRLAPSLLVVGALIWGCAQETGEVASESAETTPAALTGAAAYAFRPAVNTPPAGWSGPVFELSHDYPQELAAHCADGGPWTKVVVDFDAEKPMWEGGWEEYMRVVLEYFSQGQHPEFANDIGWQVSPNGNKLWYHVPWMAFDGHSGREFVHGLTNELSVHLAMFEGPGRASGDHRLPIAGHGTGPLYETWAFGVYNECGAYAIGQGWPSSGEPATVESNGKMLPKGLPFPDGTLVVKFLFTTAGPEDVGYLAGSPAWQANRHVQTAPETFDQCARAVNDVHLIQIDIGVVDSRSPSNWVFGTFTYDGTRQGATVWERLSPLGVQWGSDPQAFPAVPEAESKPVRESVLASVDIYEHFGCNGRLAGPVDEAESACLTCHQGAFSSAPGVVPVFGENIPAIFEFDGICYDYNQANADYFSNYKFPDQYPSGKFPDAMPLDTSLQVFVAFLQHATWKTTGKSSTCTEDSSTAAGL